MIVTPPPTTTNRPATGMRGFSKNVQFLWAPYLLVYNCELSLIGLRDITLKGEVGGNVNILWGAYVLA